MFLTVLNMACFAAPSSPNPSDKEDESEEEDILSCFPIVQRYVKCMSIHSAQYCSYTAVST